MKIRLATRGSALALAQSDLVKKKLEQLTDRQGNPVEVEIRKVKTQGDLDRKSRLTDIGGKGLFVRGIEEELLNHRADIAVHSAKDLPYELQSGLVIAGVPKAADPQDALITVKKEEDRSRSEQNAKVKAKAEDHFHAEPVNRAGKTYVIGTGSPRRAAELKHIFPDAKFRENRGNIGTRLRKLKEGQFDAIVLAKAGIDRLKLDMSDYHVRVLEPKTCIPAGCQGILAVECRQEDQEIRQLLEEISDPDTKRRFETERYVFRKMKADCSVAVGVYADFSKEKLELSGMYCGKKAVVTGEKEDWKKLCDELVAKLI